MILISSHWTILYKKIGPTFATCLVSFVVVISLISAISERDFTKLTGTAVALFLGFIAHAFYRSSGILKLADEVWDNGNSLIVVHGTKREEIPITEIRNMMIEWYVSPPSVHFYLRNRASFGPYIKFIPQVVFWRVLRKHVKDVIERIKAVNPDFPR